MANAIPTAVIGNGYAYSVGAGGAVRMRRIGIIRSRGTVSEIPADRCVGRATGIIEVAGIARIRITECGLRKDASAELYHPIIEIAVVSRNIPVIGLGIACRYKSRIRCLLNRMGAVYLEGNIVITFLVGASQSFLPLDHSAAAEFHHPIIQITMITENVAIIALGVSKHDISAICSLLNVWLYAGCKSWQYC